MVRDGNLALTRSDRVGGIVLVAEPTGCLHRVSKNPGKVKTRLIAVVLHPWDAK